jgi:hypothetical protein
MKRLLTLCLILVGLLCLNLLRASLNVQAMTENPVIIFPTYDGLISCGGSTSPTYFRVDVQRPTDPTRYKSPRIVVYGPNQQITYYRVTDSYWKNRGAGPGKKAIFFGNNGSSGVKLVVDANDFQHPTTATLTIAGQTVYFSNATQTTSGYYWTQYSYVNYTESFTCPESASLDPTYNECINSVRFTP